MPRAPYRVHPKIKVGDRFGQQEVVEAAPKQGPGRDARWMVRCDCGFTRSVAAGDLKKGVSRSCLPCGHRDKPPRTAAHAAAIGAANTRHGQSKSPTWRTWESMRGRCNRPSDPAYAHYGGRGIGVHPEWDESYEAFVRDMGERPGPEYSIDRYPDNNGNYEPGNCRWATRSQQQRNRRNTTMIETADGPVPLADLSEGAVVSQELVQIRVTRLGWDLERAMNTPPLNRGPYRKSRITR